MLLVETRLGCLKKSQRKVYRLCASQPVASSSVDISTTSRAPDESAIRTLGPALLGSSVAEALAA